MYLFFIYTRVGTMLCTGSADGTIAIYDLSCHELISYIDACELDVDNDARISSIKFGDIYVCFIDKIW